MNMKRAWLTVCVLFACGQPPATRSLPKPVPAASQRAEIVTRQNPFGDNADVDGDPEVVEEPPVVTRTGTVLPYHAYDRAEAITFNQFSEMASPRGTLLEVYSQLGWSPHISERKPITGALTNKALDIVSTLGSWELTKCTFPRHAIVLYENDIPIASINVCFECGGILTWPQAPNPALHQLGPNATFAQELAEEHRVNAIFGKLLKRWESFFHDDVGFEVKHVW